MMRILARNVENLEDARYFSARLVEWIMVNPPLEISPAMGLLMSISDWIEGPNLAVPFSNPVSQEILPGKQLFNGILYNVHEVYSARLSKTYAFMELELNPELPIGSMRDSIQEFCKMIDSIVLKSRSFDTALNLTLVENTMLLAPQIDIPIWFDLNLSVEHILEINNKHPDSGFVIYAPDTAESKDYTQLESFFNMIEGD
jgi:hypothetical protein